MSCLLTEVVGTWVVLTALLTQHPVNWIQGNKTKHIYPPTVAPQNLLWPLHSNKVFSCVGTVKCVWGGVPERKGMVQGLRQHLQLLGMRFGLLPDL